MLANPQQAVGNRVYELGEANALAGIQIRTSAIDYWASLEHELAYKLGKREKESVTKKLKTCANEVADIYKKMQNLYNITIDKKFVSPAKSQ
jgi:ppGpp synthetase/RelA/SpoT-type nucleotidyltranferase